MTVLARLGALAVLALTALLAAGCGGTVIDDAKMEATIEQNLENARGQSVSSVECPSDVEVEAGETFDCTVVLAGGKEETKTLKIVNDEADVEIVRPPAQ